MHEESVLIQSQITRHQDMVNVYFIHMVFLCGSTDFIAPLFFPRGTLTGAVQDSYIVLKKVLAGPQPAESVVPCLWIRSCLQLEAHPTWRYTLLLFAPGSSSPLPSRMALHRDETSSYRPSHSDYTVHLLRAGFCPQKHIFLYQKVPIICH